MSEVIALRVPDTLHATLTAHCSTTGTKKSAVLMEALQAFLGNAGAKVRPTPPCVANNPFKRSCAAVYRQLEMGPLTTSELARRVPYSTNNVARRIKDLADAGYVEMTGQRRKSLDSGYMLDVWRTTSREYKEGR